MITRLKPLPNKRRYAFRFLVLMLVTVMMISTNGFGVFPDNELSQIFREELVRYLPASVLRPLNSYLSGFSPQIIEDRQAATRDSSTQKFHLDPVGYLINLWSHDTAGLATPQQEDALGTLVASISNTQTQLAIDLSQTPTATQFPVRTATQTLTATETFLPTPTVTASLVWFYLPPTATSKPAAAFAPTDTSTSTPTNTPTPTITNTPVPLYIALYLGIPSAGNIGIRSSADALCTSNLPAGFGSFHAFIAYSATDNIANMPSNYGIPTNLPIRSTTGTLIASNWADMLDGTIATTLTSAGVYSGPGGWWSGAEDEFGGSIDGVTQDCNEWTSIANFVGGNRGINSSTTSTWMDFGLSAACNQVLQVLCVAY